MMSVPLINGLHHVTSISGSARNNLRFYSEILGLQLVKKTINYDSPDTWHLYYGNGIGEPGTITTFFPFTGVTRGKAGNKSVVSTMFSVAPRTLDFWMKRLKTHHIEYRGPFHRYDEEFIHFEDFDGIDLELVANTTDQRQGIETAGISSANSIKGLLGLTLSYASSEHTIDFLTTNFFHTIQTETADRIRLFSGRNLPGYFLDIINRPASPGQIPGTGTVHHIAFSTEDESSQLAIKSQLEKAGLYPSQVMDRQYFKSIYFREPGGVLFEVATAGPGFLVDEDAKSLGQSLKLPQWLEERRQQIEAGLSPL